MARHPTTQEDELLRRLVEVIGPKKWSIISSKIAGKGSKQVRERGCGGGVASPFDPNLSTPLAQHTLAPLQKN